MQQNWELIAEGWFDGHGMITTENKHYSIPGNYISKSKLVEGDRLNMYLIPDGRYIFKQTEPVSRKFAKAKVIEINGQLMALTEQDNKVYSLVNASVTYYGLEPGMRITVIVPDKRPATWAAVNNVIEENINNINNYNNYNYDPIPEME